MHEITTIKLFKNIDNNNVLMNYFSIETDVFEHPFSDGPEVYFGIDDSHFHFFSRHQKPALIHPDSQPGKFQPELWKYDVAEFFLAAPDQSEYLEFNLAPNGAWWSCFFTQPRVVSPAASLADISTHGEQSSTGWRAQASIPLSEIPWPVTDGTLNATFILHSPDQRFFSLANLGPSQPDFHRPQYFLPISLST